MGADDWNIMKMMVKEAETAGVIAAGSEQGLFSGRELEKEFTKETCMLKSALDDIFDHQAITHERIRH